MPHSGFSYLIEYTTNTVIPISIQVAIDYQFVNLQIMECSKLPFTFLSVPYILLYVSKVICNMS